MTWLLVNWKLAVIGVLVALLGLQTVRISSLKQEAAEREAVAAETLRLAEQTERAEEQRRNTAVTKEANDAATRISELEAELSAARDSSDRLRIAAETAARRARPNPSPAAPSPGKPSSDALDLLVGVLDRHSKELVAVGNYADRLMVAGVACERSYDSLSRPQ